MDRGIEETGVTGSGGAMAGGPADGGAEVGVSVVEGTRVSG